MTEPTVPERGTRERITPVRTEAEREFDRMRKEFLSKAKEPRSPLL